MNLKSRRRQSSKPSTPGILWLILPAIAFGGALSIPAAILSASSTPRTQQTPLPAFQQEMQRNYEDLFKAAIITGVENPKGTSMSLEQLLAAADHNGLQRLDDRWIGELIRLRAQLANRAGTATCASLWSGSIGKSFVPSIETLDPQEQRLWAAFFDQAARAVIDRKPIRPAPTAEQYKPALTRILSKMAPLDLEDLNAALSDSSYLSPDQECSAARGLFTAIARANRADALTVTRAMLYQ